MLKYLLGKKWNIIALKRGPLHFTWAQEKEPPTGKYVFMFAMKEKTLSQASPIHEATYACHTKMKIPLITCR